ncbi:Ig-like domain-containing protein [Niabella pedocola]|uniref:Ig-like domain-containing protein n=1 Tax=Niabella pedocola TaxID=1752077 RepID=A0ABS8PQW3_9BACT|nr:Ig-like domain-containing protein [Niabella pedocola]MCD2423199.1 Ig-like domain-containing protein [Niabella pedocola]
MRTNQPLEIALKRAAVFVFLLCLLLIDVGRAHAQQSALTCSMTNVPMTNDPGSGTDNSPLNGFAVTTSTSGLSFWGPAGQAARVTDNDLTNSYSGTIAVTGSLTLNVRDVGNDTKYNAGNYVGFRLTSVGLSALGSITISTLDASGNVIESKSGADLLAVSLGGASEVGFYTNQDFYGTRITIDATIGLGSYSIFYAFMRGTGSCTFDANALACNIQTMQSFPAYPVVAENSTSAVLALGGITNLDNMVDNSTATAATMVPVLSALGSHGVSIKNTVGQYPAGTYIAFDIENTNILSLGVLERYSIELSNNDGAVLQTISRTGGLLGVDALTGNRFMFGGVSTVAFDKARLVFNSTGLADVNLGSTNIYQVVVKKFCDLRPSFACNTLTSLNSTIDPVYINWARTGVGGVLSVNNNLTGLDNIIDGNTSTAATISTTANVLSNATISVKKATGANYPTGTYVAFDVESNSILSANVLGSAIVKLYKTGQVAPVQTSSGNALLVGAKTTLLGNNRTRQEVGVVASADFDEASIEFTKPVGADLGEVKIYGIDIQKSCDHALDCKTSNVIVNSPTGFGAIINNERSGVSGAICAGCSIENIGNVIDANLNNYARMIAAANVASNTAISVQAPASTFPAGTIAGFTIRTNNTLVGLDLFKGLSIEIWNNGTKVGSATGSQLLSLELLNLITVGSSQGAVYNVGFTAPADYDEIRIVKDGLVSANLLASLDIDVYGATVDTRFVTPGTPGISCPIFKTNPDINYTIINKPVNGSVATNDKVPSGTAYTNAVAVNGADGLPNPAGGTLSLNVDGSGDYTFVTTAPGSYSYNVTASNGTYTEVQNLTIIVTNPAVNTNSPIANTDIAATNAGAAVTVNILANDHAGNEGGTLGTPEVFKQGSNGTATMNGNQLVYTPADGFVGKDTIVYKVCETPGTNLCGYAYVFIEVKPATLNTTTATDDFAVTNAGIAVSGNVKDNDIDPDGDPQTVTQQTVTDPTFGQFTVGTDGAYTFTPKAGFSGTARFAYEIHDNKGNSANGTLYVYTAGGAVDIGMSLMALPAQVVGAKTVNIKAAVFTGTSATNGTEVSVRIAKSPNFTIDPYNPSLTVINTNQAVQNADWTYVGEDQQGLNYIFKLGGTNNKTSIAASSVSSFGFTVSFNGGNNSGSDNVLATIVFGSGGDNNELNNADTETIKYTPAPNN